MVEMPRVLVVRPVRFLPGKTQEAIKWLDETEPVRRRWGMIWQMAAQNVTDRNEFVLLQLWDSQEALNKWMGSKDREDLVTQRQRFVVYDPSRIYRMVTEALCETLGDSSG
ncbi:MAG: antibiotic biosynthesis monooxygenase [Chloroflexi bacterium]|nr:antibiotic biosynthesis monooxygenase [Chloroflexota bacterium]